MKVLFLVAVGLAVAAAQTQTTTYNNNNDDGGFTRPQYGPDGFGSHGTGYSSQGVAAPQNHENHFQRVRYYVDPDNVLYAEMRDGTLVNTRTGRRYPAGRGGARILPNNDGYGRNYHVYPDGTTYTEIDGRMHRVDIGSDGRRYYTDAQGETHYRDGNRTYYRNRDGTVYWRGTNGVRHYTNPNDGSNYTRDRFGNRYITRNDGTKWVSTVNNCNYRVNDDGSTTRTSNDSLCPVRFSGTSPSGVNYGGTGGTTTTTTG